MRRAHRLIEGFVVVALATGCDSSSRTTTAQVKEPVTLAAAPPAAPSAASGPRFDAAGALLPPTDYRTWTFLTSGFAMSYGPAAQVAGGAKMLDNVYVRPEVHAHFVETGTWPEGAMFVLEIRTGESEGSINQGGFYQTDLAGIEVEVKDSQRFEGGWGFFVFEHDDVGPTAPATLLPRSASCYTCHAKNAAVENTFTQFYPTLWAVAQAKGTVRADFPGMPASVGDVVARAAADGWPAGEALLADVATRWPEANVLREAMLNQIGYRLLLRAKQPEAATAAFEHVTRRFPGSANAWDSLSEAYESVGKPEAARQAVARALKLLKTDRSVPENRRAAIEAALKERAARLGAKE